jgi:hypothetical protein
MLPIIVPISKFLVRRGLALGPDRRRDRSSSREAGRREPLLPPPTPPPGNGAYCIRARCLVLDRKNRRTTGYVVGYGQDIEICDRVQNACRLHQDRQGNFWNRECSPVEATFLHPSHMECSGQIYYYNLDKSVKRRLV